MAITANPYIAAAERLAAHRGGSDPAWVNTLRGEALERFDRLGFPTTQDEEWRFTSVAPIAEGRFELADRLDVVPSQADLSTFQWEGKCAATLVFVNGRYVEAASGIGSLPAGVLVENLAKAFARPEVEAHLAAAGGAHHAFTALNSAYLADGVFVSVPKGAVVDAPIHAIFLTVGRGARVMTHPRVLIVAGVNSQVSVVESYGAFSADSYFTNTVTEIVAKEGATVHHYKVQRESVPAFHIGGLYLQASRDTSVICHSVSLGGSLVRNDVTAVLDGEGAVCTLNGIYLGDGTRLVDNHTTIDHARPHCASREVYKGILGDRAQAVFNGRIIVRQDAQKTDAKQTNKALLLSEEAQINTKPQLEIFADDVRCTHGAAVGQMDEEAVFYLRARGLCIADARQMLIRAFAGEVLLEMPLEALRTHLESELVERLPECRI
ncbi:MAG: Fe-S cluster assembly protein SufD [Vicinamibacterales bacterium]